MSKPMRPRPGWCNSFRKPKALLTSCGSHQFSKSGSTLLRHKALARASTVADEGLTVRPCSNRMYQSTPMRARSATSSRRRPGVRRRRCLLNPRASADNLARWDLRKSPSSFLAAVGSAPKRSRKPEHRLAPIHRTIRS